MQKLYYSISEISNIIAEEQHILRYWEKEFDILKPKKNRAGNRVYSSRDFEIIKLIKKFIRDDKLSLKGAKEQLLKTINNEDISNLQKPLSSFNVNNKVTDFNKNEILMFIDFLKELKTEIINS